MHVVSFSELSVFTQVLMSTANPVSTSAFEKSCSAKDRLCSPGLDPPVTAITPHYANADLHNSSGLHRHHRHRRTRRALLPSLPSLFSRTHQPPQRKPAKPSTTAYAIYFDHRRRTDPEFRKALKRESRKQARAAKEEAAAHGARQKETLKTAVAGAKEEGFPTDVEEKEAFFMNEVARGEQLCADGMLAGHDPSCRNDAL